MDGSTTYAATSPARDAMLDEARALVDAARERGVVLRLYGGLGIRLWCEEIAFCVRDYSDIDVIGLRAQQVEIRAVFRDLGFEENVHVSQATGGRQLQFTRPCAHGTDAGAPSPHPDDHVDVFLDTFRMDHRIDLKDRLRLDDYTLPVSDQLLTKLQVHKQSEKDVRDVLTLLKDLELADEEAPGIIGLDHIASKCANDWGLQHDVELNLDRAEARLPDYLLAEEDAARIRERLARLRAALADTPKSRRWTLRAKVGERRPWYDPVEEQGDEV